MTATEIINKALGLIEDGTSKELEWPEGIGMTICNPALALGVPLLDDDLTEMLREDYGKDQ